LHNCPKPWKQQIWLTTSSEVDIKCLIAKVVSAEMNAWDVAKKSEEANDVETPERIFKLVNSEAHAPFDH